MVQIQSEKGRFWVADGEKKLAEITYKLEDGSGLIVIDHTHVSEELRGQGTGVELVKAVVDKARKDGLKIVPECSYAAHQFKKHPEYNDVLNGDSTPNT